MSRGAEWWRRRRQSTSGWWASKQKPVLQLFDSTGDPDEREAQVTGGLSTRTPRRPGGRGRRRRGRRTPVGASRRAPLAGLAAGAATWTGGAARAAGNPANQPPNIPD